MLVFAIGLILGIFVGAFISNKGFRDRIIKEVKKLVESQKKQRRAK